LPRIYPNKRASTLPLRPKNNHESDDPGSKPATRIGEIVLPRSLFENVVLKTLSTLW
jgi:hypothetical protein